MPQPSKPTSEPLTQGVGADSSSKTADSAGRVEWSAEGSGMKGQTDRIPAEEQKGGTSDDQKPLQAEPLESESPENKIDKVRAEADGWQDKFLRLHAEWDTYRRRTLEQREAEKARAAEKLVTSLLPVIDDFERTIDYASKNGENGLLDGVQAVHIKLLDVLVKDGVQIIDPKGEAFDALEAQAVGTVADSETPDETVAEVYQKGYRMGEKVIRPAMVTVTSGGPKREKPAEEGGKK